MRHLVLSSLISLLLFHTIPAFAACSSPAAVAGTREWFSGTSEFKLCDGTNWDVIELDSVDLGACSPAASREWDTTLKAYKFCNASGQYRRINCLETGLVGHWKLNETSGPTAVDSSGNGNDGTFTNSPTPTTGQVGGALEFSGDTGATATNDRVAIADPASGILDFGSNSFSYGLWVYATGSAGNYDMPLSKGGGNITNPGYDLEFGAGSWVSYICDGDECHTRTVSAAPILNTCTPIMIVTDRTGNTHGIYVNGSLLSAAAIPGTFGSLSNTRAVNIGSGNLGGNPFLGKVDDVRIYNRALSAPEVLALTYGGPACTSYGACAAEAQKYYDVTNGALWCDGGYLRAIKSQ